MIKNRLLDRVRQQELLESRVQATVYPSHNSIAFLNTFFPNYLHVKHYGCNIEQEKVSATRKDYIKKVSKP